MKIFRYGGMNMTDVYKILNDGTVNKHTFALSAKQALIACIMQERFHNYNTWEYPYDINGIVSHKRGNVVRFVYDCGDYCFWCKQKNEVL